HSVLHAISQRRVLATGHSIPVQPEEATNSCRTAILPQGTFKKVSEQRRGRLVPAKRRTDKSRGRGRRRPMLEHALAVLPLVETKRTRCRGRSKRPGIASPPGEIDVRRRG